MIGHTHLCREHPEQKSSLLVAKTLAGATGAVTSSVAFVTETALNFISNHSNDVNNATNLIVGGVAGTITSLVDPYWNFVTEGINIIYETPIAFTAIIVSQLAIETFPEYLS